MNLEEAKANIGKEVIFIGRNKEVISAFNGRKLLIAYPTRSMNENVLIEYDELCFWNIPPQDLKLKEQQMNYKIKVTPETSAEVQELFFELGYAWYSGSKVVLHSNMPYLFSYKNIITSVLNGDSFDKSTHQEITLPQLRDMVVLKRNDVSDANQENTMSATKFYVSSDGEVYEHINSVWQKSKCDKNYLKPKETKMTWEDALRAVADGKEVEVKNISWFNINDLKLGQIKKGRSFRLKPQTIHIDSGNYTKEELLKIAGEME